jgi:cell division protein FtsZ
LDIEIDGAKGVLFAISAGDDLTMNEVNQIASVITESIDSNARVIFGTIHDTKLKNGEIKVTVIATGFDGVVQKKPGFTQMARRSEKENIIAAGRAENQVPAQAQEISNEEPIRNKRPKRDNEEIEIIEEIDDSDTDGDDWSAMPAFLRRRK